jgi:hypothetical protein
MDFCLHGMVRPAEWALAHHSKMNLYIDESSNVQALKRALMYTKRQFAVSRDIAPNWNQPYLRVACRAMSRDMARHKNRC